MRSLICLLLLSWFSSFSTAQALPAEPVKDQIRAAASSDAKLVFFNRQIFVFRAPLTGVSAKDRAKRARVRVVDQVATKGPHVVGTKPDLLGIQVHINGAAIFWVTPEDRDPAREDTVEATAQQAAAVLQRAINESAESRNLEALLRGLGLAGAATVLAVVLGWAITRVHRFAARVLSAATEKHAGQLKLGGATVLQGSWLSRLVEGLVTLIYRVLLLVLFIEWLSFVLRCFPFTRAWGESINTFLVGLTIGMLRAAVDAVPGLIAALLIFLLAYWLTKVMDRFFSNVQSKKLQVNWIDADVIGPTQRIAKVVVWLFALAMSYPYLPGSQTEAFKGLSVLVGLMLSLGASSMVGQAASGLILTYGRTYRKGEYIRIGEQEGTVTDLGVFTTRIRTGLGEELTISNATILAGTTRNYSRAVQGQGYVLDTTVTIGYDTPWRQVHAMLEEATRRTPDILQNPPPRIFQTALSDWYPVYRLVCQARPTEPGPRAAVLSALHANIQDVFNEYGVQIMSPQYFADPMHPKVVPPSGWYAAPAVRPEATATGADS
jgi:small-conductance mechanosensitive channel